MLWKPTEPSCQPRLSSAFRFQSLQARWMITSWPREIMSVPSASGENIAFPPGLSVIDSTSMRGSSASSRARSSTPPDPLGVTRPRLVTISVATTKEPGRARCSLSVAMARAPSCCRSDGRLRPPALGVRRACNLAVRARADDRADLDLHVALDDRLRRAAALLAPDDRDLVAELHVVVHDRKREHRALVVAVAGERRHPDGVVADHHAVVRPRRVVREREVDVLGRVALLEQGPHRPRHVLAVPRERDLSPCRRLHLLERFPTDEVVVELHEAAVAELVRSQVVVLDVVRCAAAAERPCSLVPVGRAPLAVS